MTITVAPRFSSDISRPIFDHRRTSAALPFGESGFFVFCVRAGIGGFYPPRNCLSAKPTTRVTPDE